MVIIKGKEILRVANKENAKVVGKTFTFKTDENFSRIAVICTLVKYCEAENLNMSAVTADDNNLIYNCCIDDVNYELSLIVVDDGDMMIRSTAL